MGGNINEFCLRINTGTSNYRSKGGILGKRIFVLGYFSSSICLLLQGLMTEKNLGLGKKEALATGRKPNLGLMLYQINVSFEKDLTYGLR